MLKNLPALFVVYSNTSFLYLQQKFLVSACFFFLFLTQNDLFRPIGSDPVTVPEKTAFLISFKNQLLIF